MISTVSKLRTFAGKAPWGFSFFGAAAIFLATIVFTDGVGAGQIITTALTFGTMYVIVALGQMYVITAGPGNVDLSIPSTIALAGAVSMKIMDGNDALILWGLLAAIGVGIAVGCFNFALIRLLSIPPIIATLSASFLVQSASIAYGRGLRIRPPEAFAEFATGRIWGLPTLAIFALLLTVIGSVVLHRTVYGRSVTAIGQNQRAAGLAGVKVDRVRWTTYVICASLAALCGAVLAGFSGGSSLNMGEEYLLASIAVVVIGGSSVAGGQSNVAGLWGASLFMYLLVTMLNTFGVGAGIRMIMTGLMIVAIITIAGGPKPSRT
ncbi:ABC transporter permease (plasmid) [Shinella sp. H4-D48]|uniref:ABC transporter permease n=1 Tax=Shinella sp. H4-D48 TaxID=2925841 RepID=UPI001F537ED0|nr:ABC transporter permease [Shinella sp. H4-D48]UNK40012.1 ABC transporter permease [Shinella sp. H4-D48]